MGCPRSKLLWRKAGLGLQRADCSRHPQLLDAPTGLGQYAKGLAHHSPIEAVALQHRLERVKWRLWHGDADEARNVSTIMRRAVVQFKLGGSGFL